MERKIYDACVKAGLEDIARDIKHYAEVIETTDRHLQEYNHARTFLLKHIGDETALALESQDSTRFRSLSKLQVTLAQILGEAKADDKGIKDEIEYIIEKQESHPIYDAFVEAGFGREARTLSTTIKGKTAPALGHYIALADCIKSMRAPSPQSSQYFEVIAARREVEDYVSNLCKTETDPEKLKKARGLQSQLNKILN